MPGSFLVFGLFALIGAASALVWLFQRAFALLAAGQLAKLWYMRSLFVIKMIRKLWGIASLISCIKFLFHVIFLSEIFCGIIQ